MKESENLHANHRARMRERFLNGGADTMQDHELLEMLLYYAIPRQNTNPTAHMLLNRFQQLDKLFAASPSELKQVEGVGEMVAVLMKLVFELHKRMTRGAHPQEQTYTTYDEIGEYLLDQFVGEQAEQLMLILLDKKGRIDRSVFISEGTADFTAFDLKKIVESLSSKAAVRAVLAHNHPSGVAVPSYEDHQVTIDCEEVCALLGIELFEHFVVTEDTYVGIKRDRFGLKKNEAITEKNL